MNFKVEVDISTLDELRKKIAMLTERVEDLEDMYDVDGEVAQCLKEEREGNLQTVPLEEALERLGLAKDVQHNA